MGAVAEMTLYGEHTWTDIQRIGPWVVNSADARRQSK